MISWSEERNGVNLSDTYTFKTSNECKIDSNLQSKCMKNRAHKREGRNGVLETLIPL